MKPKIQLFHFTRTPGVMKINDIEKCEMYLPTRDYPIVYYFGHPEWGEKTANNSGGSGSTTWQIRRKYSPEKLAGCGVMSGRRFGLAHFSNGL